MGNCNDINIWETCNEAQDHNDEGVLFPSAVACDSATGGGQVWSRCGDGKCQWFDTTWGYDPDDGRYPVGQACADGSGRDAVVMCSDTSYGYEATVSVECSGNCDNVELWEACEMAGDGYTPIGIDCDATAGRGTARPIKGATVYDWGYLSAGDSVGDYCADGSGADAVVQCTTGTRTSYAAKVECSGDCSRLTLGDACDQVKTGSKPIQVACDTTAVSGALHDPCWDSTGGSECGVNNQIDRGEKLSKYCADGSGRDAIVVCI